jgi:hypothetical protein
MTNHVANAFHFQSKLQVTAISVFAWLRQNQKARLARQAELRHVCYLRTLDRHLLEDMGVDIAALGELRPAVEHVNSYAITTQGSIPKRSMFPVNISSR